MTLSDTLTVALVLVLLIGSVALYLYTRIQQAEQKLSLLEGILLDLKMSAEVKSYDELPAHDLNSFAESYAPYDDTHITIYSDVNQGNQGNQVNKGNQVNQVNPNKLNKIQEVVEVDEYTPLDKPDDKPDEVTYEYVSYDSMTLKELQGLAKSKGVPCSSMKKGQVIEALKAHDLSKTEFVPETGISDSNFIETSSIIEESK